MAAVCKLHSREALLAALVIPRCCSAALTHKICGIVLGREGQGSLARLCYTKWCRGINFTACCSA